MRSFFACKIADFMENKNIFLLKILLPVFTDIEITPSFKWHYFYSPEKCKKNLFLAFQGFLDFPETYGYCVPFTETKNKQSIKFNSD